MDPVVLAAVRQGMAKVRTPGGQERVYKDECVFTFDTPYCEQGLYVNLSTFQGVAHDFLALDSQRSGNNLYLHLKYTKVPIPDDDDGEKKEEKQEPTKLAIGVAGGFGLDHQKCETFKEYALVVLRDGGNKAVIPWPDPQVPEFVGKAIEAVIAHQGAANLNSVQTWEDDDVRPVSKYADSLEQVDNGVLISNDPSTWKCADSGMTENLWLNLSTGNIGSGRRNWDGSGGTGAALKHFEETGNKYPLVVKLGTITANGADVYSYAPDEDKLVTDPKLKEHLRHFGIDMDKLEKTDKTMAELEVEMNKSYDFSRITEAGAKLVPLRGPGFVGLKNLGNSCYMNSVLQLLFSLPELKSQYWEQYDPIIQRSPSDPTTDLLTQMAKLSMGMFSQRYNGPLSDPPAEPPESGEGYTTTIEPRMFKYLVGKGHPEFSSMRQQDAPQFMEYLLDLLLRAERVGFRDLAALTGGDPSYSTDSLFRFQTEDRVQCVESGQVRYRTESDVAIRLPIPMDAAVNKLAVQEYEERKQKRQKMDSGDASTEGGNGSATAPAKIMDEEEEIKPVVPFLACLDQMAAPEMLEDYMSQALGRRGTATKLTRFKTFPRYLIVQLRRYIPDERGEYKKLEALIEAPDQLDLTHLRGTGAQPGEVLMAETEEAAEAAPPAFQPDPTMMAEMLPMGFSENACTRALKAVNNSSSEAASNWLFEHMEDPDLNDPLPAPTSSSTTSTSQGPDPQVVSQLMGLMGFTEQQATAALKATDNNPERAADWLFSHLDDMESAVAAVEGLAGGGGGGSGGGASATEYSDGEGKYDLVGFISHVGKNTTCGHYVAHICKEGRWVIFDDEKVALSEHPPRDLAYIYLYARSDAMNVS